MFEGFIKELKKIENSTYSMKIMSDEEGYIDKECPDSKCKKKFKVFAEDWNTISSVKNMHCPFCGYESPASNWFTTEQVTQARRQAMQKMQCDIDNALAMGAKSVNKELKRSFNRKSFIKMSVSYNGGNRVFIDMPANALDKMQQKIECPFCHFRYEVVGSGFFCPKCGENSAEQTFNNTIEKVKGNIKNLTIIYNSVAATSKDEATRTCESLRVNSLNDLVVAFQRLCETLYTKINPNDSIQKNLFQRLDEGSKKFKNVINYGYDELIEEDEFKKMIVCFQKRHCYTHKDGIVDDDYINKSGDNSYKLGQHLNIANNEILAYTKIVEKLGTKLIEIVNNYK